MRPPAIRRSRVANDALHDERGVTMVLVALAMVGIIAMAALSIDVITLYLAREEAQAAADAAALAAARVLSSSGILGDVDNRVPSAWTAICGGSNSAATKSAQAVAAEHAVGGAAGTTAVMYSAAGTSNADCSTFDSTGPFGVNPMVTVTVTRSALPTFFSRMWGSTGNQVSASATAEAFNSANSGRVANVVTGTITPVQPRCVKPWLVPNLDPLNPSSTCGGLTPCNAFVDRGDGHIVYAGISTGGGSSNGVIGEKFLLVPDCHKTPAGSCSPRDPQPTTNTGQDAGSIPPGIPNLEFVPGQTLNSSIAVPSGLSSGDLYEQAIAGCDATTVYYCGVSLTSPVGSGPNLVDFSVAGNPAADTMSGVMALINEGQSNPAGGQPTGQDYFSPYAAPSSYPYQILAGSSNAVGLTAGTRVSSSRSIVSLPIYDTPNGSSIVFNSTTTTPVTIVGFLQVFIDDVDQYGNITVNVLNVTGCGNGTDLTGPAVTGSSPVPVRLVDSP